MKSISPSKEKQEAKKFSKRIKRAEARAKKLNIVGVDIMGEQCPEKKLTELENCMDLIAVIRRESETLE